MLQFDDHFFHNLEKLCRIQFTEEEKKDMLTNMNNILKHMEELNSINTDNVQPCSYVLQQSLSNVLRKDEIGQTLSHEDFLRNAPDQIGGMIRTPPVMKN
jgi:aspartyl-tRNA(Asn)/glutamyl-tRNA(Gln) amidotransferase subunit C